MFAFCMNLRKQSSMIKVNIDTNYFQLCFFWWKSSKTL